MNLGEMRNALRRNIFDIAGDFLDDGSSAPTRDYATGFVNDALQHVANWADRQDQGLFHAISSQVTVGSANEVQVHFVSGSPTFNIPTYATFRRLLAVEQVNDAAAPIPLQVITMEERMNYWGSQSATPRVYVSGHSLYVVAPSANTKIRMRYVYSMPPLKSDTDNPGESEGESYENNGQPVLPTEYHPLVVSYATVLALAAEASQDVTIWQGIYAEQRDELSATLAKRRGARIGGSA